MISVVVSGYRGEIDLSDMTAKKTYSMATVAKVALHHDLKMEVNAPNTLSLSSLFADRHLLPRCV